MTDWNGYITVEFVSVEGSPLPLYNEFGMLQSPDATETFELKHNAIGDGGRRAILHATWKDLPNAAAILTLVADAFGELPENLTASEPGDFEGYGTIILFYSFSDLILTAIVHDNQAQALAYLEAYPWQY